MSVRVKRDSFSTQSQSIIQLERGKLVVMVGGGGVREGRWGCGPFT